MNQNTSSHVIPASKKAEDDNDDDMCNESTYFKPNQKFNQGKPVLY